MNTPIASLPDRDAFPALRQTMTGKPLVWLDSASTTLKPEPVLAAIMSYYHTCSSNVHRAIHTPGEQATAAFEQARSHVQHFLHARSPAEIVFTSGTTDSINMVACCLQRGILKEGDEILITGLEHHANIVPWQMLQTYAGIKLRVVPVTDGGDILPEEVARCFTNRTRLLAISAVSNAIGTVLPLQSILRLARDAGIWTLVDAAQAAATMPIDVQALDCDFLALSGHKVFGPTGIGILYGKASILDALPPCRTGGDMIRSVTFEKTTFNDLPWKFEAGTPNIAGAIGLGAAIQYVERIGFDAIMAHEADLLTYARAQLSTIPGIRFIGHPQHAASILSILPGDVHPHDAGSLLNEDGIAVRAGHHCAQPLMQHFQIPATVRLAFSLYNSRQDVDAVTKSIKRVLQVFA